MKMKIHALTTRITAITENEPGIFAVAASNPLSGQEHCIDTRPMRSASLIKLFIMAEAFARITDGDIDAAEVVAFREADRVGGAGILQWLPAGTCRTLIELVELMITESDNIATNLLIDRLGAGAINARIHKMNCHSTCLRRHMMDFAAAAEGRENMTSATDTAKALVQIFQTRRINSAAGQSMPEILGRQTDRCKIPLLLPEGTVCQHKTGELPGAEHDAGIVYSPAGPYVVAIMSDNLADPERGRQVVAQLSKEVYEHFASGS